MKILNPIDVDAYIASAPEEAHSKLREIRTVIREVAPDAYERTDYFQIPGYSYEGYDYNGMFVWFSFKKSKWDSRVLCIKTSNSSGFLTGI